MLIKVGFAYMCVRVLKSAYRGNVFIRVFIDMSMCMCCYLQCIV
jgi:hypothetical protein